jgi:hypothetical protein
MSITAYSAQRLSIGVVVVGYNPLRMLTTGEPGITFGDNVRVLSTPETKALGVAGFAGQVHEFTTPSVTGIAVVGRVTNDHAINVHFEGRSETLWFAPELLTFVDHSPGTEINIRGSSFVRTSDGGWAAPRKQPWWKFWT